MASIIKDIAKKAKNNAVKSVGNAVFGSGIVGGALNKSFQKKFGDQEEGDTRVADALEAQTKVQDQNSAVLTRIETIVMNIADNVYNLAGVMNAQVVSMQEAQKIQQERAYKEEADKEEAAAEAKKVQGPSAAGSTPASTSEKGGIMGMLTSLAGSIGGTRKLFKGFLKKFGILALGITAALGVAAIASKMGSDDSTKQNAPPVSGTETTTDAQQSEKPPQETDVSPPTSEDSSEMARLQQRGGSSSGATPQSAPPMGGTTPTSSGSSGGSQTAPSSTPVAPPPSVAATSPAVDPDMAKLEDYFNKPENAAERAQLEDVHKRQTDIKEGIRATKELMQGPQTPEDKARNESILKLLEPRLEATKKEKKAILDKARKSVASESSSGQASAPSAPSVGGAQTLSSSGGAGGISASTGSGGGGGATPVPPSPSTGAVIGDSSTAVAAASEPSRPKNSISEFNASKDEGSPPPSAIPSPIANRGSLDIGTVFGSES